MNTSSLVSAFLLIVTLAIFCIKSWRFAIQLSIIMAILEGALRKWVFPQASEFIYFLKDIILLGAYIGYFYSKRAKTIFLYSPLTKSLSLVAVLVILWLSLGVLNPISGSIIINILGVKNYIFYFPLLWLVPKLFSSEADLRKTIEFFLITLIPVGILAILQFFSPPDSIFNIYAPSAVDLGIALGGNHENVRVTGTFSYIAGYTVYLSFCISLILPLLTANQRPFSKSLTLICFGIIIITLFMTGSRGVLFSSGLIISGYILLQGKDLLNYLISSVIKLTIPLITLYLIITTYFNQAVSSLWLRVINNQDINNRVISLVLEPIQFTSIAGLMGYGPGSAFQGSIAIRSFLDLDTGPSIPVFYESEPGRITLEIGFIGFFLWYLLRVTILLINFRIFKRLQSPFLKRLSLSICMTQLVNLAGQIVFNHTANIFYWFLNGLVFALPYLEQQKQNYAILRFDRSSNP